MDHAFWGNRAIDLRISLIADHLTLSDLNMAFLSLESSHPGGGGSICNEPVRAPSHLARALGCANFGNRRHRTTGWAPTLELTHGER